MDDNTLKNDLTSFDSMVRKLVKNWHVIKNTSKSWNLRDSLAISGSMLPLQLELQEMWNTINTGLSQEINSIKEHLDTEEYVLELENELKNQNVPINGSFPQYELPPFKLMISLDNLEARLSLGRKNERTPLLNPQELAKWVSIRYKRVSGRKFNSVAFMKDLLNAYQIANRLVYREKDEAWGRAVPLHQIYELLTLKQASRQDYPRQFFIYDLGLLKEQTTISLEGYRFELGFARNQSRSIVIVDSLGRESRISSLTIYREE
jgi:hypothetical protein